MANKTSPETRKLGLGQRLNQDREDKQYTDVTIRCGNTSFAAHKVVLATGSDVFGRMVCGQFKEGITGVIDLSSERVEDVKAIIDYLYQRTYTAVHFDDHIRVYVLADQYNIQGLGELSLETVRQTLADGPAASWYYEPHELPNWSVSQLADVVRSLWHEPSPAHVAMRRVVMKAIWKHKKLLLSYQTFRELIKDGGEFVLEFTEGFKQPAIILEEPPEPVGPDVKKELG